MRRRFSRSTLIAALLAATLGTGVAAQQSQPRPAGTPAPAQGQDPPRPQLPSVQVAVPEGNIGDRSAGDQRQRQVAAERARIAALPIPRNAQGRVVLGPTPTEKGVWIGSNLGIQNPPYMPWTREVSADRRRNQLEPHTRCKPSGGPRQFLTPYGAEFVELPDLQRAFIFDIGGPHTYRTIYMDGRKHPAKFTPDYYGHSIGWWEGDTLVVDTVGFNEDFWIDRGQIPHTTALHLIEKFTRTAFDTMKYEITVDDPLAYTSTFSGTSNLRWEPGTELFEYVCQQSNFADELMVGQDQTQVDRSTLIVP